MTNKRKVATFIISLDKDKERREVLGAQLESLNIPYSVLKAVHGASLSEQELETVYDRSKAIKLFNRELSKGEIGCALSHISIYKRMVSENIPYALILEDDARVLVEDMAAVIEKLADVYSEDKPVVTLLNHVERYNANKEIDVDGIHRIYEAYRGVAAHGYFITRAAAKVLSENIFPAYVVADKWEYFQEKFVQVDALVPYVIGLTQASLVSSIAGMGVRHKKVKDGKNYQYYLRRHFKRLVFVFAARPFIRIRSQEKAQYDV